MWFGVQTPTALARITFRIGLDFTACLYFEISQVWFYNDIWLCLPSLVRLGEICLNTYLLWPWIYWFFYEYLFICCKLYSVHLKKSSYQTQVFLKVLQGPVRTNNKESFHWTYSSNPWTTYLCSWKMKICASSNLQTQNPCYNRQGWDTYYLYAIIVANSNA